MKREESSVWTRLVVSIRRDFLLVVVQLLSRVQFFATSWTAACQASLSFAIPWSSLTFRSVESVKLSTISSSATFLSFCLQSFPASGSFPMSQLFTSGGQRIQLQSFQWIFTVDFLYDWLVWSSCSPRDSQESFPAPQFKSIHSLALSFLYGSTLTSIHGYWKTIALTIWTFVAKVMSLLFNMLSRFVISFRPRSKSLLISWLHSLSTVILEPQKIKSVTASTFSPSICHKVMRPEAMILVLWMLSFKPTFSLSSFTLIKRLFSSSSLSAFRVVSAYLRLLIFLPAILILACDSSSLAFHMMYSAYKLNRQSDNIQPWCTSFPILNQSIVLCLILTVASWPTYRFHRKQVRWSGIPISLRIFQFFVIHSVKGFTIVNEAEVFQWE